MALAALLGGLALVTLLVLSSGAGAIWHGAAALGWAGFAAVAACHLGLIGLMGSAWWLLGRRAGWLRFAWGRLMRDSASEALPLSQIGGYAIGARALALAGLPSAFAAGSTVVDVTVELAAQLGYTLIGLAVLHGLRPDNLAVAPALAGVGAMAVLVVIFFAVQARGADAVVRIGARVAGQLLGRAIAGSGAVRQVIQQIHARPGALGAAAFVHLGAWVLSGVETWVTLRLMGVPVSPGAALVIDSLLYGMRSAAFMVPNAVGVQEGGLVVLGALVIDSLLYGMRSAAFLVPNAVGVQEGGLVVLGGLFGMPPDMALALSLVKRGRDLVIGVPALLAWQALEGRRAWDSLAVDAAAAPARPDCP